MVETGRRLTNAEITPAMLRAGARAFIVDDVSSDEDASLAVLTAALLAGGYTVSYNEEVSA